MAERSTESTKQLVTLHAESRERKWMCSLLSIYTIRIHPVVKPLVPLLTSLDFF